ncbi:MAG: hypothetical protein AB7P16_25475 [Bradyrhizobium sp.]
MPDYGTMTDGIVVAVVCILLLVAGVCSLLAEWYGLPAREDVED